ncbi:MAG: glutamate racemase [Niabella sp.]
MSQPAPIGVFDSGYGGLTVLREFVKLIPQYDYIYLGDNARAPYGNRSFQTVYEYTLQAVQWFFEQGCSLVILACNTASAKALRTIQQNDLPRIAPQKRVLGVIRPATEAIGNYSETRSVGILATSGTVASGSYPIEIAKFFPDITVYQQACPLWVPLIENNETDNPGTEYFIKKYLHALFEKGENIDAVMLACTHYPLIKDQILEYLPIQVQLLSQGEIVANSLQDYLNRHPEIETLCNKTGKLRFYTTDDTTDFDNNATRFFGQEVNSLHVSLDDMSRHH